MKKVSSAFLLAHLWMAQVFAEELTITGGSIIITGGETFTAGTYNITGGTLTLSDGTFTSGSVLIGGNSLNISGGAITGGNLTSSSGNLTISGGSFTLGGTGSSLSLNSLAVVYAGPAIQRITPQSFEQSFGSGENHFKMEFVTIGNPGNTPSVGVYSGNPNHAGAPYSVGAVNYVYNLGKHEVSREMIDKANASGGLGISMFDLSSLGGNGPNRPASGITWHEAARFVNYLNTSQDKQAAYNLDESGNLLLWAIADSAQGGVNRFRHKDAVYFLPSIDEWYKGAYGTPEGTFLSYPTENGLAPTATAGGTLANTAVYGQTTLAGPANITEAGGLSAWGTMGQGGNVYEWVETALDGQNDSPGESRELRGGGWTFELQWSTGVEVLLNSFRTDSLPNTGYNHMMTGFRVAAVGIPEPSTLSLFAASIGIVLRKRRRRI
ncbi:MAG: PEP-CTERM sorting domain-containing protein [Bacteroidetes bacterium]|nr:PEP-CTERM sorting domain-containing protein [Bacteroidota bacterium]